MKKNMPKIASTEITATTRPLALAGYPIAQLDTLMESIPQLDLVERKAMAEDVRSLRKQLRGRTDPWNDD